jgi:hypothetical protein
MLRFVVWREETGVRSIIFVCSEACSEHPSALPWLLFSVTFICAVFHYIQAFSHSTELRVSTWSGHHQIYLSCLKVAAVLLQILVFHWFFISFSLVFISFSLVFRDGVFNKA